MLERATGQKGLWWLWHLSATGLLLALLLTLRASVAELRQQTTTLRQQLETQQQAVASVAEIKTHTAQAAAYARHAACASLFTVAMNFGTDPWEFFEQVTGQTAQVCREQ